MIFWTVTIFSLALGFIIGSFLNVVLFRYGTGRGFSGRSGCLSCASDLSWAELVPIFSFLIQKGECRKCHSKISLQYPIVELGTGLLFFLSAWTVFSYYGQVSVYSILVTLAYFVMMSFFVLITVYDLKHKIIPDEWIIGIAGVGLILPIISGYGLGFIFFNLANRVIASLILGAFFYLIWYLTKGKAMGFGDVKLALAVGLALGLAGGIAAIVFAFWIGAIVGILLILLSKKKIFSKKLITMKSEIPFAPFIVLGAIISLLVNINAFIF